MVPEIIQHNEHTWIISEGFVRVFLLEGSDWAMLIDSGLRVRDLRKIAAELTDKPLRLLNTHGDMDHIGCNGEFDHFYMHPAEEENYRVENHGQGQIDPVVDGDRLDLGGRVVEIVHVPGHTPGSIAVLDPDNKLLFGGDSVQDFGVFMFGPNRGMEDYRNSMAKLAAMTDRYDTILASHGTLLVPNDLPAALAEYASALIAGDAVQRGLATETAEEIHGKLIQKFVFPRANFYTAILRQANE